MPTIQNKLAFPKAPTGIKGLDEITGGGLPAGRPTLICGSAGCGKTIMAMEFLLHGATEFNEPGVFMTFEETGKELIENVSSLGFDLDKLIEQKKFSIDYVRVERNEIDETGEYDLEGLFIRLNAAITAIGAKRVVLDTIESLFVGLSNESILRAELRRLFRWLKDKGMTAIITGERGANQLTRHGLEEYVSDCVILLDHRVTEQHSTRRLRIIKYRGSSHGTNEYPFLIDENGISVLPISSLKLEYKVSNERISTGIDRLDNMFDGKGYFRGSSILVSGTAGSGKTSLAASLVDAACRRGEKCIYYAFEEPESQIIRNMRSIGIDLEMWVNKGLLHFHAIRPTLFGLETHLTNIRKLTKEIKPNVVVIDPISNFISIGYSTEVKAMLMRLIDFFKMEQITTLFTNLTLDGGLEEQVNIGVSSLMDTWLLLRDIEYSGERNRCLHVLKSRGMAHSNQVREFKLTNHGIDLLDMYVGPQGMLTGSARLVQEANERAAAITRDNTLKLKEREIERNRRILEARIAALHDEYETQEEELRLFISELKAKEHVITTDREAMAKSRQADTT